MMAASFPRLLLPCLFAVAVFCCTDSPEAGLPRVLLGTAAPAPQPQPQPPAPPEQYLSGQNLARAEVGVAPLRWSPALGAEAGGVVDTQRATQGCQFADLSSSRYGANQAWASYPQSAEEAVRSWVAGEKYYNYGNNSCAPEHQCGTYTQVVWKNTVEVGCAQATCATAAAAKGGANTTSSLTLCLYRPPGNFQGEKPY